MRSFWRIFVTQLREAARSRPIWGYALLLFLLAFVAIPLPGSAELGLEYVLFVPIVLVGLSTSALIGAATGLTTAVVYVIENNFDGQLHHILVSEMPDLAAKMVSRSKCDGLSLSARWITEQVNP